MKQRLIIGALVIISILIISGCAQQLPTTEEPGAGEEVELSEEALETKELIEKLSKEAGLIEGEEEEEAEEDEEGETTEELLKRLSEEAGLIEGEEEEEGDEEETEEEEEEITEPQDYTIIIELFTGDPEDLTVAVGSSITWINEHPNFLHYIGIREKLESGKYDSPITEDNRIYGNQTFTFTFEEPGTFQWYSETKYPDTSGIITVEGVAEEEETGDNETEE